MRLSQREQLYSQIKAMLDSGVPRPRAIEAFARQHSRPIDSVRRDFNLFAKFVDKSPPVQADSAAEAVAEMRRRHELLTVMHLCDVHFPDHDPSALSMAYEIVKCAQPHIVVIGSDQFDLSLFSTYGVDADAWDETPDILDQLRGIHRAHVDRILEACPSSLLLFIHGNHEDRFHRWVNDNAPKLRSTLRRSWIDMITYDKKVFYIEEREIEICNALIVRHGDRHNIFAARSLIEQERYQTSIIAGHTHRPQDIYAKGRRHKVVGATSGCLSTLTPKYMHGKPNDWMHGTIVAHVHQPTNFVQLSNLIFHSDDTHIITIFNGKIIKKPRRKS